MYRRTNVASINTIELDFVAMYCDILSIYLQRVYLYSILYYIIICKPAYTQCSTTVSVKFLIL